MMRVHHNPDYYLKPIFIFKPHPAFDTDLKFLYDGEYKTDNDLPELGQKTWDIFLRTTELEDILSLPYEAQIIKRVMNYFHTRNISSIHPTRSNSSTFGFVYPMLSSILKGDEEYKVIDLLEWAEQEGLIAGEFYERFYLCNSCSGGFLSFREVCPTCHSSDSITQDLVHHFPCAYVGPISDFSAHQNNELTCPKCDKNLKSTVVDSVIFGNTTSSHSWGREQDAASRWIEFSIPTPADSNHIIIPNAIQIIENNQSPLCIYPNPAISATTIFFSRHFTGNIYNGLGVFIDRIEDAEMLTIDSFQNGVYFFKEDKGQTYKWIKLNQ